MLQTIDTKSKMVLLAWLVWLKLVTWQIYLFYYTGIRWPGVPGYPGPNVGPFKPFYPGNRWRVRFRVFPPFSGYFCKVLITLVALNFTFWGSTLYVHFIKLLRVKCDAIDQFLKTKKNVFAKNRNGYLFPLKIFYIRLFFVPFCTRVTRVMYLSRTRNPGAWIPG